eukprot:2324342-Amphidinium_carterae.1
MSGVKEANPFGAWPPGDETEAGHASHEAPSIRLAQPASPRPSGTRRQLFSGNVMRHVQAKINWTLF